MKRNSQTLKRKFMGFFKLPVRTKFVFIEAFLLLGFSRTCVLCFHFKSIAAYLGKLGVETTSSLNSENIKKATVVTWAIHEMSNYTPWLSNCLAKSIAGMIMLRRRKISSTLYFGLKKSDKFEAHAWLRSGDIIVTGDKSLEEFYVITFFGK